MYMVDIFGKDNLYSKKIRFNTTYYKERQEVVSNVTTARR